MDENEREELAVRLYEKIDEMLPDVGIRNYGKNDEELKFRYIINGDDIPMTFILSIIPSAGIITLISPFSFNIKDKNIINTAIAVAAVNNNILNGSFDLDMSNGSLYFRLSTCFSDDLIDREILSYLVGVASSTVDRYNDRLLALDRNVISLEDFLQWTTDINSN